MPREYVHWSILDEAITRLQNTNAVRLRTLLRDQRDLAMLGALTHDAPYYVHFAKDKEFTELAEWLHGNSGEDTYDPIRTLGNALLNDPEVDCKEQLWAFLCGMISHCITDTHFHPAIFYFTGNYYDSDKRKRRGSQNRHRIFEVYLDSWCRVTFPIKQETKLRELLKRQSDQLIIISHILASLFPIPSKGELSEDKKELKKNAEKWNKSFQDMSRILHLVDSFPIALTLLCLSKLTGIGSTANSLSSFLRKRKKGIFDREMQFKNPVTGNECITSFSDLYEKSVNDCVALFLRIDPHIESSRPVPFLVDTRGKSLSSGVYGSHVSELQHFRDS